MPKSAQNVAIDGLSRRASSKSSRASHLYMLKREARRIREEHAAGRISAEDAATMLRQLHSSSVPSFFKSSTDKAPA